MKKGIIAFLSLAVVFLTGIHASFAFTVPTKPNSFVNDYANILSVENKSALESKISNFEKQTTNEIAVVIIPSLDGDTIENVAQDIFTKWGIGKKDKNNGVLLLFAMAEHKTRIHTGYGVEGSLTDLATSYIQSEIIAPAFRVSDYYGGINNALDKIIESLNGGDVVPAGYNKGNAPKINFEYIFLVGIFVLQVLISILGRSKSWWAGGVLGGVIGGNIWLFGSVTFMPPVLLFVLLIIFGLGLDFFVSRAYQKAKNSGNRFPWWIGGGGGGHSGGGFGGFGGGFSGGGGSSGSW